MAKSEAKLNQLTQEQIKSEKRAILKDFWVKALSYSAKAAMTAWAPQLLVGFIGSLIDIFLSRAINAMSEVLARGGFFVYTDWTEGSKLSHYEEARDRLRVFEAKYKGGDLTPEEKKANEEFDENADDNIAWPDTE